ncbi:cAMP-regulated phosphoprotein 19 [Coccinella septempunctata]|uniref:cAMP-regulated phosphoprotein 19 n=1 Tax=Coccinella septempunctata TaxID=41139 RepID=UPI001D073CB8|nr:cAMP-regulated phosphoprotein 19 [Coccinella septempunctata]
MSEENVQQTESQEQEESPALSPKEAEKKEEEKLRAKYPSAPGGPGGRLVGGHSAFLQKRLAKGQKYFDSGDYQMAKQKRDKLPIKAPLPFAGTGEAIPTPDTIPVRKTSIMQSTKYNSNTS